MSRKRHMEFMNIAMKYFPEGKERLKSVGIDVSLSQLPIFMDLFTKVMDEAYEMGKKDALKKK
ncbi:MAG: ComZ family protein [Bacillus sp. (in: firmicutes)]